MICTVSPTQMSWQYFKLTFASCNLMNINYVHTKSLESGDDFIAVIFLLFVHSTSITSQKPFEVKKKKKKKSYNICT